MNMKIKWPLLLLLSFVCLFAGFVLGAGWVNYRLRKDQRQDNAFLASKIIQYTTLLREGRTEDAIKWLDIESGNLLYFSAYHKNYAEMTDLPEDILSVWQEAKIYYDRYDIQDSSMVGPVRNKLEYVPWSWKEGNRRRFEAKYKGPVPQVVPELKTVRWFGQEALLDSQKDKVVLLDFWGTSCGPCLKGLPKVQQLHDLYKDRGLVVIGLTFPGDDDARITKIIRENTYTFHVAKAHMDTLSEYAIAGIPTYFLIDKTRCLVWGPEHEVPSMEMIEKLLNN